MKSIVIRSHLGLGDMLVINAIVRDRAENYDRVFLPCKTHNVPSVAFMFRDLPNVEVVSVKDDNEANEASGRLVVKGSWMLGLGMFAYGIKIEEWDKEMYRQAGMPLDDRWDKWKVERDHKSELQTPEKNFIFLHEDVSRGFAIESDCPFIQRPNPRQTPNIFDWWRFVSEAEEIHCIDSCFAILADSIPTKAKRHVLHLYARPNAMPPHYRKNWEILK